MINQPTNSIDTITDTYHAPAVAQPTLYERAATRLGYALRALALTGLVAAVASCASLAPKPDFYPAKGAPHTLTYTDKSTGKEVTAFDLNGDWEAPYSTEKEIVRVIQKGNSFEGFKTRGNWGVGKDEMTIRGTVNGNVINCEVYHSTRGWAGYPQKIEISGNSFVCSGNEGERVYNRQLK